MDSNIDRLLRHNRNRADNAIKADRAIEAVSRLVDNVSFLYCSQNDIDEDIRLLVDATKKCSSFELQKKVRKDLEYARRIEAGKNLDPDEIDFMHSLVGGVASLALALNLAGQPVEIECRDWNWVREFALERRDLSDVDRRFVKNNRIHVGLEDLLTAIDELQTSD